MGYDNDFKAVFLCVLNINWIESLSAPVGSQLSSMCIQNNVCNECYEGELGVVPGKMEITLYRHVLFEKYAIFTKRLFTEEYEGLKESSAT